jgi:MATE family multidrug resistance protein
VAIGVSVVVAVVAATLLLLFRQSIAGLYTNDSDVLRLAADLLLFVAVWQLVDNSQVTTIGVLRGFKDTRMPMLVALLAYWMVGLPVGAAFGFGFIEVAAFAGLRGFWLGLCVGLLVAAVVLVTRFVWLARQDERIFAFAQR